MKRAMTIIIVWYGCIAAIPAFSQCGVKITGIDSIRGGSSTPIMAYLNMKDTALIISGAFGQINTVSTVGLFRWDGTAIGIYNQGFTAPGGLIQGMAYFKNKLYIGGGFAEVDNQPGTANLAIWDGSNWSGCPIGEPLGGDVYDMAIYHDTLFICGRFWCFGSTSNVYREIIATDGTGWFNVGSILYTRSSALTTFNDKLYLGGTYGMMEYQGDTNWIQFSPGPNGKVKDMDVDTFNNILYVGGYFSGFADIYYDGSNYIYTNQTTSRCVAMYDGFEWHSMGTAINCDVYEQGLKTYRGDVYVGGCFEIAGGSVANYIARWNGTQWDSIQCNLNSTVEALEVFQDTLYIGGYFTAADGTPADGIVKYFSPDTGCHYMQPRVLAVNDTFKINNLQPNVEVQFYNNNAYADGWDWDFDDGQAQIPVYTQNASHVFDTPGSYQVAVTVNHQGCTKTASKVITIINNTGTEEYTRENLQFKLYPNPTSGEVTVECTLPADKIGELRTHQVNGSWKKRYALQGGFNQIVIPENEVSSGISMVSLFVDGEFVISEKVVRTVD